MSSRFRTAWQLSRRWSHASVAALAVALVGVGCLVADAAQSDNALTPNAIAPHAPGTTSTTASGIVTTDASGSSAAPGSAVESRVFELAHVVDGDTVYGTQAGAVGSIRIRFAIIDTPERGECWFSEATDHVRVWMDAHSGRFRLRRPSDAPTVDSYGRTLGEVVSVEDPTDSLNVSLGAAGAGRVDERFTDEDPDLAARLRVAQERAVAGRLGMWSCGAGGSVPAKPVSPTVRPTTLPSPSTTQQPPSIQPSAAGRCDPSYPTVCIPPGPDLDCGEISFRNFTVLSPDPHGFDRDKDGVGCET